MRRKPDRANSTAETIYKILDQAFVCNVGFVADGAAIRRADKLCARGRQAFSAWVDRQPVDEDAFGSGAPFCLSVTLLDGIVFSPTAMGHSVNYRSVVVIGQGRADRGPCGETCGDARLRRVRDPRAVGDGAAADGARD